jgi:hypothetical protein
MKQQTLDQANDRDQPWAIAGKGLQSWHHRCTESGDPMTEGSVLAAGSSEPVSESLQAPLTGPTTKPQTGAAIFSNNLL